MLESRGASRCESSSLNDRTKNRVQTADIHRVVQNYGWHLLRYAVGGLLLTAAFMKVHQLSTVPYPPEELFPRWLVIAFTEFEIFLALWLFFGIFPRLAHRVVLLIFVFFSCVTFYKALTGEASCGCFGQVQINPWYTLLIDVGVVGMLMLLKPVDGIISGHIDRKLAWRVLSLALSWLAIGAPSGIAILTFHPAQVLAHGKIVGGSRTVLLEPGRWEGVQLPLFQHIDIGNQLRDGRWLMMLYHDDCPLCRSLLQSWEQGNFRGLRLRDEEQVAVIRIPEFGLLTPERSTVPITFSDEWSAGHLNDSHDWFVETPVVLRLEYGQVASVFKGVRSV